MARARQDLRQHRHVLRSRVHDARHSQSLHASVATARMAGWAAHRFEEIVEGKRIIRPAYKAVNSSCPYVPMDEREQMVQEEVV